MFEPQDDLNRDLQNRISALNSEKNIDNIDENLSSKNVAIRKKQLEKLFARLVIFGLALGVVLGIGTYYLVNKLGLNKKPYQLEQEKLEREKEQQAFSSEMIIFPSLKESFQTEVRFMSRNNDLG